MWLFTPWFVPSPTLQNLRSLHIDASACPLLSSGFFADNLNSCVHLLKLKLAIVDGDGTLNLVDALHRLEQLQELRLDHVEASADERFPED